MNNIKIKNQSGMSLVEIVLASTISLFIIAGIVDINSNISQNQVQQNIKTDSFYEQETALNAAKSVLFKTYSNETGKRTEGICKNISIENLRPGINYVEVLLDFSFFESEERWRNYVPSSWTPIDCSQKINISSKYKKCFQMIKENKLYYTVIGLNTINIDAKNLDMLTFPENQKKEDIKKIAFDFNTLIFNHKKEAIRSNKLFIPASHVEYCEVRKQRWFSASRTNSLEKEYYKVYPSGSGLVDSSGDNIYNSTSFEDSKDTLLEFQLLKSGVQAGKIEGENLSVDSRYNVEISCNERVFKCSNSTHREFDDTLDIDMILDYSPNKTYPSTVNADLNLSFSSRNLSSIHIQNSNINSQMNRKNSISVKHGTNNFSFSVENIQNTCNNICSSAKQSLFYRGNFSFNLYRTSGEKKEPLKTTPEVFSSTGEVACTTCYMKSCARLGLGTFGPIQKTNYSDGHPIEPLDGGIPECASQNTSDLKSFSSINKFETSQNNCLSANFKNGKIKLKNALCSTKLPVMCFSFGKFRFARDIKTGIIKKATKLDAPKICFEQGLEILNKNKIIEWLNINDTSLNKYFNVQESELKFINLANQGLFIAPQTNEQVLDTIRNLEKELSSISATFWTAYDKNTSGYSLASLPQIVNLNTRPLIKESSLLFELNSVVNLRTHPNTIENFLITPNSHKAGIVLHNIKHKGVAFINDTQERSISYVCFNKQRGYFISSGVGKKYQDGVLICKNNSAYFYPPQTPLQWSHILLALSSNEYNKPFPDTPQRYYNAAWVAVEPVGTNNTSYTTGLYQLHQELSKLPLEDNNNNTYKSVYDLIKANTDVTQILAAKVNGTPLNEEN